MPHQTDLNFRVARTLVHLSYRSIRALALSDARPQQKVGTQAHKVKLARTDDQVISYIFTVDVKPADAREVIFITCKAGNFMEYVKADRRVH
jgi:hypothetical protein